jgi:amino acid adenylation domain-containing protein
MTLTDFVEDLEAQGVELWVHEDRLRYRGRQDLLRPEVIAQLKERKEEIMALQRERAQHSRLFPPSHGQSSLWFLSKLAPTSFAYHVGFAAEIYSQVNVPALQRALQFVSERHAGLRTTFRNRNGIPVQEIHSSLLPAFEAIHLGPADAATLRTKVIEAHKCPFDLERGPLLRVRLFTCTPEHHVLLLTVHHLVCDAWSLWLLLKELGDAYQAEADGAAAVLPPLGADYTDFVRWQRELIADEEGERLWAYWKKQLVGELPVLNLATDRPRPPVQTFNGGSVKFRLGPPVTARVRAFAAAEGTTPYMTLLATFAALLHRYSGQEEVLLGSPTSGRTERQFADILGDFINTVVVRSSVAGDPSFRAYLDRFSKVALEAIAHERFPFSLLVERLRVSRDPSRSPLFQVLFNFLKPQKFQDVIELWVSGETGDLVEWGGLSLGPFALPQQEGQVDLALEMIEGKTSLLGILKYNVDLFDSATIERMAGHFETLLEHIVVDPDQPLSRVPLLREAERHELLIEWNDTKLDYPANECLHELFEKQVKQAPQAVAVEFEGKRLTYSELNSRANQLGHYLRDMGVGPDTLVGVFIERSLEMVVALLGVLKAGGAYVPLDPSFPQSRLSYMVEDSGMRVLITHRELDKNLQTQPASIVRLDSDWEKIARQSTSDLKSPDGNSESLAYVLYTSGSTGKPKGVEIPHSAVVNFLHSMQQEPGFAETDTLLAVTTLSFDIAGLELYLPLVSGGRVVVASSEDTHDPVRLMERMRSCNCTVMQATPATWRALIDAGWSGSAQLKVLCGGESLPRDLLQALLPRCKELWNMYGPTETTIWSTIQRVTSADGPVLIGRPIANTQTFVLDACRNLVPQGVPGELYIGGAGVARDYLGRPELTEERFVQSPFEPSARLYRTGDLVRWTSGGCLECLGRVDTQVKIRGFRIELGEIETALSRHEAIRQCVVVAREDAPGDKRLVAYFEPRTETTPTVSDLRAYLVKELPGYMVPSIFVPMDKLPVTPNGKIDRKALPIPGHEHMPAHDFVPPQTETEKVLAQLWTALLRVDNIGIDDEFFHLGGHSLLAIQAVSRIREAFGVHISAQALFDNPTIAGLANVLTTYIGRDRTDFGCPQQCGKTHDELLASTDIKREVRSFLVDNFLFGRSEALHDDDSLLGGVIDSPGTIELVVFLEDRFALTVEEEDVVPENFGSVKHIVGYVASKLNGKQCAAQSK